MALLSTTKFAAFLNADGAPTDLEPYLAAAEEHVDGFLIVKLSGYWIEQDPTVDEETGETIPAPTQPVDDTRPPLPASLQHAIFSIAAHFHENREAYGEDRVRETPMALWDLVNGYRVWSF